MLGVEPDASPSDIRTRYRVLAQLFHPDRLLGMPENVRQEAERRMKELNVAYGQLESGPFKEPKPTAPTVINPGNRPLSMLPETPRGAATDAFWNRAGIEPVMIRLGGRTGLTLATPSIHDDDARVDFLSDHQGIHVARSVEGLISLASRLGPWRRLAPTISPRQVVVLPEYRFDLTEALDDYQSDSDYWDSSLLTGAYNLSYEMAQHLELDEVIEAMMPGSALYQLYTLVRRLGEGAVSQWRARQGIARFDHADVFQAWCDIIDNLSGQTRWHP